MKKILIAIFFLVGITTQAQKFKTLKVTELTQAITTDSLVIADDTGLLKYISLANLKTGLNITQPTGLEAIDEGNGFGWRLIGKNTNYFGNIGENAIDLSVGIGNSSITGATGNYSFAQGWSVEASGDGSFAIGGFTAAKAPASFAGGGSSYAYGNNSFSFGTVLKSQSFSEFSIGLYGTDYTAGSVSSIVSTDRLFNIGNGIDSNNKSNALTILKNGTITAPSLTDALITTAGDPSLITKKYADANYLGINSGGSDSWQKPIISTLNFGSSEPASPTIGDRYIAEVSPYGSELVVNGGFDTGTDWSSLGTDTYIGGGVANFISSNTWLTQSNIVGASVKDYELTYEIVSTNNGTISINGASSAFGYVNLNSSLGTHTVLVSSDGINLQLQFNSASFIGTLDNISVKEVIPVTSSVTGQVMTNNNIYEWNGADWTEIVPEEPYTLWNKDLNTDYIFNNSIWNELATTIEHNNLKTIQGGNSGEYYHLDAEQYNELNPLGKFIDGTNILDAVYMNGDVGIATTTPKSKLQVNGGIQMADDTDVASIDKVGTLRYRIDTNNSYLEMCMQTAALTYTWVVIKTNTW